jgi:hypothetical protein
MEELLKLLGFTTPLIYAGAAYGFFHIAISGCITAPTSANTAAPRQPRNFILLRKR